MNRDDFEEMSDYWWRTYFLLWQTPYILWYRMKTEAKMREVMRQREEAKKKRMEEEGGKKSNDNL